ncbi:MAG: IS110 family transposase [Acidimicrobiia bacterium]|nr:IS110 family transposase [Acidimicrobiia bacterium]
MITLGIDAHKRTHTVVAVDDLGRQLGTKTTNTTTTADHLALIRWADRFGPDRSWAVEDCRNLSRRLERDMLAAGERIVRVPAKLMAHSRDSARTYGKSDPIDALAVARAALREPDLPTAHLDDEARELRLLVDHREDLVAERTRHINRLRWHLHEIDPSWDPNPRAFSTFKHLDIAAGRLAGLDTVVARIARELVERIRNLTVDINQLRTELEERTETAAPTLSQIHGISALAAAKLIGEVAGIERFHSRHAFARHNGTAPTPVWSANHTRHRLSRAGNRQLNAAIHRAALTQARSHPDAIAFLEHRANQGSTRKEAIRSLKRRLSDVIYRAMVTDATLKQKDRHALAA